VRNPLLASWLLSAAVALPVSAATADPHQAPAAPAAGAVPLGTQILDAAVTSPDPEGLGQGALEGRFGPFTSAGSHLLTGTQWFRLDPPPAGRAGTPVLVARSGMEQAMEVYGRQGGHSVPLDITSVIPKFGGAEDEFALPSGLDRASPVCEGDAGGAGGHRPAVLTSTLAQVLEAPRPTPASSASPSAR
jgi:hypothetical protein